MLASPYPADLSAMKLLLGCRGQPHIGLAASGYALSSRPPLRLGLVGCARVRLALGAFSHVLCGRVRWLREATLTHLAHERFALVHTDIRVGDHRDKLVGLTARDLARVA